jgi:methionine biosynthesis protein MetW
MSRMCSEVLAEVDRALESLLREAARRLPRPAPAATPSAGPPRRVLDVGCWDGAATVRYAALLEARPLGIEIFADPAGAARARGVEVSRLDLERDVFPWPDGSMDLVIANQVLEHLKNVWHAMAEMARVLRPGGYVLLAVPNLASLHNRVLLALGRQPTTIRTAGPHVRSFTLGEFRDLVARGGALEVERVLTAGFYPLPARWARPLNHLWPGAGHTSIVLARKREGAGNPWLDYMRQEQVAGLQTHFE